MKRPIKRADLTGWREAVAGQFKAPFRGEIWDFFREVPMGRGLVNQNKPFDIGSAMYIAPVQQEIRRRPYGKFVIKAGVQILKTHCTIEMPCGYFISCDPGDLTMYFAGDDSAYDQAKARTMEHLRKQANIKEIIDTVINADSSGRFNVTTEAIYLPNMVLRIWPLNESSTQRISLRYVLISDAFLSKKTGLLRQAMARVSAHDTKEIKDYKIIIESQGGEDGDDFDEEWKDTDQRNLHFICPRCKKGQEFVWHRERGSDFIPTPTEDIPSLDHKGWIDHHRPILLTRERKHAGMKRGDKIKTESGEYDKQAVLAKTHYECFHCGSALADDALTRKAIDHSSYYVPSFPKALPENIGFWFPQWCGQRKEWGKIMLQYLIAKQSHAYGNEEPIKQFWQKIAGRSWNPNIEREQFEIAPGSYDPKELIPNEFCRNMATDCQQDREVKDATGKSVTGYFWYVVRAIDKFGNSRQIARGFCKSWKALIDIQHHWKVPNDRHCIDMAHWPEVVTKAAMEHEVRKLSDNTNLPPWLREKTVTWYCLLGSDSMKFTHPNKVEKSYSPVKFLPIRIYDSEGKMVKVVSVKQIQWSNFQFKHQLDLIRSGISGVVKFESLAREHLDDVSKQKEAGNFTYEKQMESEFVNVVRGKDKYETISGGEPHYRDCECMILVRMAMDGQIGHFGETTDAGVAGQSGD